MNLATKSYNSLIRNEGECRTNKSEVITYYGYTPVTRTPSMDRLGRFLYLGGTYDDLDRGESYDRLRSTTFIAITDQNLYAAKPEFYARYQLLNIKTHEPYTTIYNLNVLNLTHKDIATEDDIGFGLTGWADMFLASTWEELKAVCTFNVGAKEAAEYMLQVSAEQSLKTYLEAHERYLHSMASQYDTGRNDQRKEDAKIIADRDATIANRDATITTMHANLAKHLMSENPDLGNEEALSMASKILG